MGGGNKIADTYVTSIKKTGSADIVGTATLTQGSGITLTQTGNDITIATAGGGASGYDTVVVAAATGTPGTDTANIQSAINALPAGGGSVVLREGNYVLNANITFPSGKPIHFRGLGKASKITLDATYAATNPAPFRGPATGDLTKLVMSDFEFVGGTNQANLLFFLVPTGQSWSDLIFERLSILSCSTAFSFATSGTGTLKRITIKNCSVRNGGVFVDTLSWSDVLIEGNYIEKQATYAESAVKLGGTNITFKGNWVNGPDNVSAGNVAVRCDNLTKGNIEGNKLTGNRGIMVLFGFYLRDSIIANNLIDGNTFGTDSIKISGEISNSLVSSNKCEKDITLDANAASTGNVIEGNKTSAINDNSGQSNTVVSTYVTGVRKLGSGTALKGDVKLDQGSGITLTQDDVNNKITIAAAAAAGNWALVANLTNTAFGQTFTPDFTGLSLATHRSYMLMFELSLSSGGAGPNWVALRLNGAAPTTLQQYMMTDQQGAVQDDEGSTFAMAKILKVFPGGGSSVEVSGCIIITGKVNSGFPHAVGWYTVTNQSAVEQMHRGNVGLRMNLGSGVDLTSLGLFSNVDLSFLVAGSCRMSLYQAQ